MFPAALCYTKIVPVDEVITLTLFYREDDHLVRLMLDDAQAARLDRLWDELRFISQDALTLVDALAATDGVRLAGRATPRCSHRCASRFNDRAAAFRQALIDAEPKQLEAAARLRRAGAIGGR